MIEIPFILLPIIVLALTALFTFLFNGFNLSEPKSEIGFFLLIILSIVFIINVVFYILKGIEFIYNHVTIV
jgi:hypothetical protein